MARKFQKTATRRRFMQVGGATTAALTLAGCLGDDDDDPVEELDPITITQGEFPDVEDPNNHITGAYFNIYDHVYEPLFDIEPGEPPEPRIVTDWDHQGDGTVELEIRDDVTFHDGRDLIADDIVFTIERQIDPEALTDQIAGLSTIQGADVIDDTTFTIEYSGSPQLAEFEFGNYLRAVSEEWWEEDAPRDGVEIVGEDAEAFNGTGPLEVVEYDPGAENIVLEPYEDYWGDPIPFESITFEGEPSPSGRVSSLIADETDMIDNVLPGDVGDVEEENDVRNITSFRNIFLVMKDQFEPFDSQDFRQAMNYAVDNQEIINELLGGFGAPMTQPVPEGINGYNPDLEPYERDIDRAEQLVEDSGYAGSEITLYGPSGRYLNDEDITIRAADHIDQLSNVSCDYSVIDFDSISATAAEGFDDDSIKFFLIGWGVVTGDTDYGVDGFLRDGAALQNFSDEELSDLIVQSKGIEDADEREEALMEINEMAREKAPWVFLHLQESIYGINPDITWEPRRDESIFAWEMS